jgi:hypothetical protein
MIFGCGGTKEDQHNEKEGKLYGISPLPIAILIARTRKEPFSIVVRV